MATVESEQSFDVVPTRLAVKAMRDSGYKNAAYAIAELVDNAVQAGARCVEILCKEDEVMLKQQTRRRVQQIAVVDDGGGMSADILRRALQFGNGERLNDRSGIGRFGMGLPNSSISQGRRVDVWSWQSGHASAMHTYLDLDEIEGSEMREVPVPEGKAIPAEWRRISATVTAAKSGTLVLWSKLDKCDWKTAQAIFRNSDLTIGRIYRYFLSKGKVRIRTASFVTGQFAAQFDEDVRPNDPLYLMAGTSTPAPWDTDAMFEAYGDPYTASCTVDGKSHIVTVRISNAKKAARSGQNAGGRLHGKHAAGNIGVSVVRAGRELELQTGWCVGYDPRERWWGIEVDFPPALDEIFGVPNNKQGSRALADFSTLSLDQMALREGYASEQELKEAWVEDNDPRMILVLVKINIQSNLQAIRKAIKAFEGRSESKRKRHEDANSAESRGKSAAEQRERDGNRGDSDVPDNSTPEQKVNQITRVLEAAGLTKEEARPISTTVVESHAKFVFYDADMQTPEFFTVSIKAGAILIGLNTNHPAYEHLIALRSSDDETDDVATLKQRLNQSYEGLRLLLESWARYEDELSDGRRKEQAQEARLDWGRVARDFFRHE